MGLTHRRVSTEHKGSLLAPKDTITETHLGATRTFGGMNVHRAAFT